MAQDGYVPEDIDYLVKIVVIGDSGVGKSNIMTRYDILFLFILNIN